MPRSPSQPLVLPALKDEPVPCAPSWGSIGETAKTITGPSGIARHSFSLFFSQLITDQLNWSHRDRVIHIPFWDVPDSRTETVIACYRQIQNGCE
jgi:hypothetical protein